jgi:hexosaminidase
MRRLRACLAAALLTCVVASGTALSAPGAGAPAPARLTDTDADAARPTTIPALQQWQPRSGSFSFSAASRVVVPGADARALRTAAADLARDRRALGLGTGEVSVGRPRTGDVLLDLSTADGSLGAEGYSLEIGSTLTISGPTVAGVFYGTQTALQLAAQGPDLPAGLARDWPQYGFRGVMLDNGRKYFTPEWISRLVRQMGYLKYNVLHLHLSDNDGFRIESERHPEVVSPEHLTKAQVREIVALAARHHITVVPEIDSPGHLRAVLAEHPEHQITKLDGRKDPANLNFVDPAARQFIRGLLEEYVELFPGPWWHIGGDEFVFTEAQWANYPSVDAWAKQTYGPEATHDDAFADYVNWLDSVVRSHGKRSRMWSGHLGGRVVRLDPRITNEVWHSSASFATPAELVAHGSDVVNAMYWPTYYVVAPNWYVRPDNPLPKEWYEDWKPWEFDADVNVPNPHLLDPAEGRLRGGKFHIWTDWPTLRTQEQIAQDIAPRLRIMTQKLWGSPLLTPDWLTFAQRSDSVPEPPRVSP